MIRRTCDTLLGASVALTAMFFLFVVATPGVTPIGPGEVWFYWIFVAMFMTSIAGGLRLIMRAVER